MNVFRELRKINSRNVIMKTRLLCIFSFMLILSTYAWFQSMKEVKISGLEAEVVGWDVEYYIDENMVENEYTFTTSDFYPGMEEVTEKVKIYNTGESPTNIELEIVSVKMFGEEIYSQLVANNEITKTTNQIKLFDNAEKYPFNISYTLDKTYLSDKYIDETSTNAIATMNLNVSWEYDGTIQKDVLDTGFGAKAYNYYKLHPDATEALEIKMKITSSRGI